MSCTVTQTASGGVDAFDAGRAEDVELAGGARHDRGVVAGAADPEEERLVDDLLYELRLRFVEAQEGTKRIIEP